MHYKMAFTYCYKSDKIMNNLVTTILMILTVIAWICFATLNISIWIPLFGNLLQLIWLLKIVIRK